MPEPSNQDPGWQHIAPQLDAALSDLAAADRDAILLRYFENKSARQMADLLGIAPEAAQKRVNRAVERLRANLERRGIPTAAGSLAAAIAAYAVPTAPARACRLDLHIRPLGRPGRLRLPFRTPCHDHAAEVTRRRRSRRTRGMGNPRMEQG
jgi:hypothetical protein